MYAALTSNDWVASLGTFYGVYAYLADKRCYCYQIRSVFSAYVRAQINLEWNIYLCTELQLS